MLPAHLCRLTIDERKAVTNKVRSAFLACTKQMMIENDLTRALADIYIPLAACLTEQAERHDATRIIGINGAQGAGKTTFCKLLKIVIEEGFAKRVATFSIDDIYLTLPERQELAKKVHPLLETRGVPGTHNISLGMKLLYELKRLSDGQTLDIPTFDKTIDDRAAREDFCQVTGPIDILLFEGWCVGAKPQCAEDLSTAVNQLESLEDPDLHWRRYVNERLQQEYQKLFNELDMLIMLKVPGMASVMEWRSKQEHKLANSRGLGAPKIMGTSALKRFIMHYERLTKHILNEMPDRADIVYELNEKHQFDSVRVNLPRNQEVRN